ncbi:MAG TPA: hemolysin family protein [Anaerolineales bacterium]|nr:HlyC/CorC family transporter [Anaerolineales bacterium]HMS00645.1 hemolysin family protein [Anaerolineales bacterium]HNQ94697.1 hemolysin family protein [Anaerolineales bacterium]HNS59685.1 hemolysin family protein [Anaerolineales bacterium]
MTFTSYIIIIIVVIFLNAIFVLSEMSVASSRKARLQQRLNEGDKGAKTALDLMQNPNLFLATVQIGITLVGVFIGAVGGASLAEPLAIALMRVPQLTEIAESLALGIVVVTITFFSIILGELVPKRIALHNPEQIASALAGPMMLISKLFAPFVWLLGRITDFVLKVLGIKPGNEPPVTEEEIQLLIDQGTQAGVFEEAEHDMVEGVFSLGDQRVYSLMTPRTDVVYLDVSDTLEEIRQKITSSEYSRFPVRQGSLDSILGIVKARDLLVRSLSNEEIKLKDLLKPAFFIPETMFASRALEVFKEKGTQILLVIDEFGGLQGLITINDILEEIVGQMEHEEPQATQRQDGSWLLDGMLEVDEFKEIFKLHVLPHEDEYETLSGFVMMSLGRVPQAADHFEWHGLRFEVIDMDGRRVDKVLVTTLPQRTTGQEPVQVN